MTRVFDLDNTPWVLPSSNFFASNVQDILRTNDSEWHQPSKLSILFDGVFIVLLNIVWEVINGDAIMFNVLHHEFLRFSELCWSERVGLANDGNDVNTWGEALHQFNIQFSQTMAGRGDEVEESVNAIIAESGVTLDSGFLSENVVILALEVSNDF